MKKIREASPIARGITLDTGRGVLYRKPPRAEFWEAA
jgi:hypothetical protein